MFDETLKNIAQDFNQTEFSEHDYRVPEWQLCVCRNLLSLKKIICLLKIANLLNDERKYRHLMVFENEKLDGAYSLNEALDLLKYW